MKTDPSFRKITFNAHETTCQWWEARYGYGWTMQLRELMDRHMTDTNRTEARAVIDHNNLPKTTLGDLAND